MLPYFLLLSAAAIPAILAPRSKHPVLLAAVLVIYVFFIGFRWETGADWSGYEIIHETARNASLSSVLTGAEPASNLLFWISSNYFSAELTSNVISALIFMAGLMFLASRTQEPFLCILSATPYLAIVIAMSGVRQAMAIGLVLAAVAIWRHSNLTTRFILLATASCFHLSAILLQPLLLTDAKIRPFYRVAAAATLVPISIWVIQRFEGVSPYIDRYARYYLAFETQVVSPGALAHVLLVAVPGGLYLFRLRQLRERGSLFLVTSAGIGLALIPLSLLFSTAASRFSLYFQYVPLLVYPALLATIRAGGTRRDARLAIVLFHFAYLWVWLRFANTSDPYIPYRNMILLEK